MFKRSGRISPNFRSVLQDFAGIGEGDVCHVAVLPSGRMMRSAALLQLFYPFDYAFLKKQSPASLRGFVK